jgi:hypothetical protein
MDNGHRTPLFESGGIESGQARFEFNGLWFDIEFEILRR